MINTRKMTKGALLAALLALSASCASINAAPPQDTADNKSSRRTKSTHKKGNVTLEQAQAKATHEEMTHDTSKNKSKHQGRATRKRVFKPKKRHIGTKTQAHKPRVTHPTSTKKKLVQGKPTTTPHTMSQKKSNTPQAKNTQRTQQRGRGNKSASMNKKNMEK